MHLFFFLKESSLVNCQLISVVLQDLLNPLYYSSNFSPSDQFIFPIRTLKVQQSIDPIPHMHACSVASVMSDPLRPRGLQPSRLLCPWDSSGKNTGVVAMPSSRGSSQPRDGTRISYIFCIGKGVLYHQHHLGSPTPYPQEYILTAIEYIFKHVSWWSH